MRIDGHVHLQLWSAILACRTTGTVDIQNTIIPLRVRVGDVGKKSLLLQTYKNNTADFSSLLIYDSLHTYVNQGIIDWAGTETRQNFSRMFAMAKELKSCLPLL